MRRGDPGDLPGVGPREGAMVGRQFQNQSLLDRPDALMLMRRLLEQLDSRPGTREAGPQVTIHLHQGDLRAVPLRPDVNRHSIPGGEGRRRE